MNEYHHLTIELLDTVGTVTLNRPEKGNALNIMLMKELVAVCQTLRRNTAVRVVIFRGAGKHFCTGMDLASPELNDQLQKPMLAKMRGLEVGPDMVQSIFHLPQITIAELKGLTLGGGACIATACDFRIAADTAQLGYPEANLGMNLSWQGLPLCVRLVGPARAKRLVILGDQEPARLLHQWGLIDELSPEGDLVDLVATWAQKYASQPPIAAQMIKKSINHLSAAFDQAVMHMDRDQFILSSLTEDFSEAITAFSEKRPPKFTGN